MATAFVDTNILLRAMMPEMAQHSAVDALVQRMWDDNIELWISRQVLREYLVQVTHPASFPIARPVEEIVKQIEAIQLAFQIVDDTEDVTAQLLLLLQKFPTRGKQIHDANIVATMVAYKIDTLLTLNIADMRRFESIIKLVSID